MPEYIHPEQQRRMEALQQSFMARTEWPTWLALLAVYSAWGGVLYFHESLGMVLTTILLALSSAWFMSVQHELVHGHPTRHRWLNKILGYAPFAVWFPFTLYLTSHLHHHKDENLTLPGVDPESNYVSPERWERSGPLWRWLYLARLSFWGRFLLGPAMSILSIASGALTELRQGDYRFVRMWLTHGTLTLLMLWGVNEVAGIHPLHYLLGVAYPAYSIAMIRSYFEHRATADCKHRIAINEASWPMRLLFLNNNFHLVHHDLPGLAWYLLPQAYWPHREAYLKRCAGFRFGGYAELARRFGFSPIDAPLHPGLIERQAP